MPRNKILSQAIMGGIIYFVISLILARNTSREVLLTEGTEALIFAVVYGLGLWVYHRFIKKGG